MYYDYLRFIYGESEAFLRFANKEGKLIIAKSQANGDTRLFVRSLNPYTDIRTKDGWWNTFTITKKPCTAGTYICKIVKVRADKDGYPIFVAEPILSIDEKMLFNEEMMYVFGLSTLFTEEYIEYFKGFNVLHFNQQIETFGKIDDTCFLNYNVAAAAKCVNLYLAGKVTKEQIIAWLNEPTEEDKERERILDFFRQDLSAMAAAANAPGLMEPGFCPLLAKKCLKKFGTEGYSRWKDERYYAFIRDLETKYMAAVNSGKIEALDGKDIFAQIEAYLAFDEKRKAAQKAEKTAKKKAKKHSAVTTAM